jgi:hypothetical protein
MKKLAVLLLLPLGLAVADAPPKKTSRASMPNLAASRKALAVARDKLAASISDKELGDDPRLQKALDTIDDARAQLDKVAQ